MISTLLITSFVICFINQFFNYQSLIFSMVFTYSIVQFDLQVTSNTNVNNALFLIVCYWTSKNTLRFEKITRWPKISKSSLFNRAMTLTLSASRILMHTTGMCWWPENERNATKKIMNGAAVDERTWKKYKAEVLATCCK